MRRLSDRLFLPRNGGLLAALLVAAGIGFCVAPAAVAQNKPKAGSTVQGIHVQRQGDWPAARDDWNMLLKAKQAQCGSGPMQQMCKMKLSEPGVTSKTKAYCAQMMSHAKILGNPANIGQSEIHEYFVPALGRAARIITTFVAKSYGPCEIRIEPEEKREILHVRPDGHTRYERKKDKSGNGYWAPHELPYRPGLGGALKGLAATKLSGKVSVSKAFGHKTLVPARPCEISRISAGGSEIASCLYATGLPFPSHIEFESKWLADGKAVNTEAFVSFAYDAVLPHDLFFPDPKEELLTPKNIQAVSRNERSQRCAAEKARTGTDLCENDDDDDE